MKTSFRSQRGSALMTVLLVTAGLMVMLASYHSLVMFNLKSSHRSYHGTAAMNLAETGLEEGMWAINQKRANPTGYNYAGWTVTGDVATREFVNLAVGTASSTSVKVKITNCNLVPPAKPTIKAQAILSLPNGMPSVEKWVEITLNAPSSGIPGQDGPPAIGFVSKLEFKFNGNNPIVDSWNSDPLQTGAMVPYSPTTKNDEGFVGSVAVSVDTITVSNADIKGFVATYQDTNLSNNVGPNGSILADDSPAGTKIDSRRVSTDFKAVLPDVVAPPINTAPVTASTLPVNASDGVIDPKTGKTVYYYKMSGLSSTLTVKPLVDASGNPIPTQVVLVVPSPYNINLTGSDGININNGASLSIYAGGDVTISGKGVANGTPDTAGGPITATNMQKPSCFTLYGTAPSSPNGRSTQTIKVAGNGALSGVIYAPNADVVFTGNAPHIYGAATGNTVTISGNAEVHYDESLGKFAFGTNADSGHSALAVALWRELLSPSERVF